MQSKRVRVSKMINLRALVLRPSLLATALTMSYCQLSWGREQQFSYNAAFTTSRPVEQKCRFSPQFHIFLNAAIDWSPLPFCQTSVALWIESWQRENWNDFQQNQIWDFTQEHQQETKCNQSEKYRMMTLIWGVFDEGKCVLLLNCGVVQVQVALQWSHCC